jgi:hypothetical protein
MSRAKRQYDPVPRVSRLHVLHRKRMHSKDAYMLVYSQVSDLISAAAENSQSVVEPPPTAIEEVTRLNHAFGEEIQKSKEELVPNGVLASMY